MTIALREYQDALIGGARQSLRDVKRVLCQAPTGAGKTVLAAFMVNAQASKDRVCFFCVHRQELVDQTSATFNEQGIRHSFVAAGYPYDPNARIFICSIPTLKNRKELVPRPHLVIVDEAHHAVAKSWRETLDFWPEAYVVGLSATPERLDGTGLGTFFESMVEGPNVFDLISQGFLSQYKLLSVPLPVDLTSVKGIRGEFDQKVLAELLEDNEKVIGDIVAHWEQYALGRKTIGFAINVAHSMNLCDAFNMAGYSAIHLDAKTPKKKRRELLGDFARGKYDVVWNVGLFGEGFDLAMNAGVDCTVECVISARPTLSLSVWLQQVGRALRPKDLPAVILDHAGNVWRHGLPDDQREWSLNSRKRRRGLAPVKECPECLAIVPAGVSQCGECGHKFETEHRELDLEAGDGDLVEIDVAGMRDRKLAEIAAFKAEEQECPSYQRLVALAQARGYRFPHRWAEYRWRDRQSTLDFAGRGGSDEGTNL